MPALPPAPQCLQIRLSGANQGTVWNCIFHTQYTGTAPTSPQLVAYAGSIGSAWNGQIGPLCNTSVTMTGISIVDLSSNTAASAAITAAGAGALAGAAPAAQVALTSSWHANVRYRGGHARNYWPGGVMANITGGNTWTGAFLTTANANFTSFLTSINGLTLSGGVTPMIVLSYKTKGAFRPVGVPFNITSVTVHPRVDTQRRRLGKERP